MAVKTFMAKYIGLGEQAFIDSIRSYLDGPYSNWHLGCSGDSRFLHHGILHISLAHISHLCAHRVKP